MKTACWNLATIYPSIESEEYRNDFESLSLKMNHFHEKLSVLASILEGDLREPNVSPSFLKEVADLLFLDFEISTLQLNMNCYIHCRLAENTQDESAEIWSGRLLELGSTLNSLTSPLHRWVQLCHEQHIEKLLQDPRLTSFRFAWQESRKLSDFSLSSKEEELLSLMAADGFLSWSRLYDNISGAMSCELDQQQGKKVLGIAETHSLLRSSDELTRREAWKGIQSAWQTHEIAAAAILNGLAGWRLREAERRSHKRKMDFLSGPLSAGRLERETLSSMLEACEKARPKLHELMRKMAQVLGKNQLAPWDLLAETPLANSIQNPLNQANVKEELISYEEGMSLISHSLGLIDSKLSDFVQMLEANSWIEGRLLPNKRTGGFCMGFPKTRSTRIFMSYRGSFHDVMTLAHEIGHAYHSWVMRDLALAETRYPMTLAETASVFSETAVRDVLLTRSKSRDQLKRIVWSQAESAMAFLVNIPARYEFEKSFYEKRQRQSLSAKELCALNTQAWEKWYGNTLSEMDPRYWSHKLHFAMARPFYNFPYTFGYLFSYGVYTRRTTWGQQFFARYNDLLCDTGKMTCEEIGQKHLGVNLRTTEFWESAIEAVHSGIMENFDRTFKPEY